MIKVSSASSLFQEKGLEANGVFTLLLNAIERDKMNIICFSNPNSDYENILNPCSIRFKDCRIAAVTALQIELAKFSPDIGYGKKRIDQFFQDYASLKSLKSQMEAISFWDMLFKKRKEYKTLAREKAEIEEMSLSANELLNVAFFHCNCATKKTASEFVKELKFFLEQEYEKYH